MLVGLAKRKSGVKDPQHMKPHDSAGDAGQDGDETKEPKGDEFEEICRFDTDLAFLSEVARRLAPLAARPGLAPEKAEAIERAVAALKNLPALTPGIDLQIEVAHRMGGEEFSESYSYLIKLNQQGVEIGSSGSQYDAAVGSNTFNLESLKWRPDGQTEHKGNRDTWLERLAYALARDYTLNVTDESGDKADS
jgi:hypothetical protein